MLSVSHLDSGWGVPSATVHTQQGDGVELALVQVHHGHLRRLVLGGLRRAQHELEVVSEGQGNAHTHTHTSVQA